MKIIEFYTSYENHENQLENKENNENHRIPYENYENHWNPKVQFENLIYYKNLRTIKIIKKIIKNQ